MSTGKEYTQLVELATKLQRAENKLNKLQSRRGTAPEMVAASKDAKDALRGSFEEAFKDSGFNRADIFRDAHKH